jgi:Ala-tRNA(Pro) deacylase
MNEVERRVYEVLDRLGIRYFRHEHPPVYTVEEAEKYWADIPATHCKNLFLRNRKGDRHYLVVLERSVNLSINSLAAKLGEDRLSFSSPERLMTHLGLTPGSVSPLGLINDIRQRVIVVVDAGLRGADQVGFHPNVNTATVRMSFSDFERFLAACGNPVKYLGR